MDTKQRPKRWHKALAGLRAKIDQDIAAVKQLKKQYEWNQAHLGEVCPHRVSHTYATWEHFCNAGQVLIATHHKSVARLSLASYERGLALLNAICYLTDERGYAVSMAGSEERLRLSRDGAHVQIRVAEKMTRSRRDHSSNPGAWNQLQTLTPTGRLTLIVEQQGVGQTELVDKPGKLLEDQLTDVLAAVTQQHQRSLTHIAERAQWKREFQETALKRREQESRDREVQQRADEEARRRLVLIAEVEDWHRAELIRAYLSVLDNRLADGGYATDGYEQWRAWALRVADGLDQSDRRVDVPAAASPPVR